MSDPFISQISIVGFNFPPRQYAQCDGAVLAVSQNPALASLLGSTFGGNGQTTFGLPELRGRVPLMFSPTNGYNLGMAAGVETVTLSEAETPSHSHTLKGAADGTGATVVGTDRAFAPAQQPTYRDDIALVALNALGASGLTGGTPTQPHNNMQPFLALNFVIALEGAYPPRN